MLFNFPLSQIVIIWYDSNNLLLGNCYSKFQMNFINFFQHRATSPLKRRWVIGYSRVFTLNWRLDELISYCYVIITIFHTTQGSSLCNYVKTLTFWLGKTRSIHCDWQIILVFQHSLLVFEFPGRYDSIFMINYSWSCKP